MDTMPTGVWLAIFGAETALFEKYGNYYATRISQETNQPISEPVTKLAEALVLLYEGRSTAERRLLTGKILPDNSGGPAIQISVFGGGYCKDQLTNTYLFPIAPELVKEMQDMGILSGTPHMGYTDDTELNLNERSVEVIIREIHKFAEEEAVAE